MSAAHQALWLVVILVAFNLSAEKFPPSRTRTCPRVSHFLKDGKIVAPSGWNVVGDYKIESNDLGFVRAGWGTFGEEMTKAQVICYYFDSTLIENKIRLQTIDLVDKTALTPHLEWREGRLKDSHDFICQENSGSVFNDVRSCPFDRDSIVIHMRSSG